MSVSGKALPHLISPDPCTGVDEVCLTLGLAQGCGKRRATDLTHGERGGGGAWSGEAGEAVKTKDRG